MIEELAKKSKLASQKLKVATTEEKNAALLYIAEALEKEKETILAANEIDLKAATEAGLTPHLLDRLSLKGRLEDLIADVRAVAKLTDPVGTVIEDRTLPNGLRIQRKRVPLGVIGIIYESRPNVTVDISILCIKTGNCAILRGGSETLHTNSALTKAIQGGLIKGGLPRDSIQLIESRERSVVKEMIQLDKYIDMIIPRGGEKLQRFCLENSTIPVITGGAGICHLYVEKSADFAKAVEVILNAKVQRPLLAMLSIQFLSMLRSQRNFYQLSLKRFETKKLPAISMKDRYNMLPLLNGLRKIFGTVNGSLLALSIKIVDSVDEAIATLKCIAEAIAMAF